VGAGSLQRFIEHDPDSHYFNFDAGERQRLRPVVLFDLLINNADRKGGHVILDGEGKLWLIDHGICFHIEDKLCTVIGTCREPIPGELLKTLEPSAAELMLRWPSLAHSAAVKSVRRHCLLLASDLPKP
jgi:hypothetical protein